MGHTARCSYLSLHPIEREYVRDTKERILNSVGASWTFIPKMRYKELQEHDLGNPALFVIDSHGQNVGGRLLPYSANPKSPAELNLPKGNPSVVIVAACYQGDDRFPNAKEWAAKFPNSLVLVYCGGIGHKIAAEDIKLIAEALGRLGPELPKAAELYEQLMAQLRWAEHVPKAVAEWNDSGYCPHWIVPGITVKPRHPEKIEKAERQ